MDDCQAAAMELAAIPAIPKPAKDNIPAPAAATPPATPMVRTAVFNEWAMMKTLLWSSEWGRNEAGGEEAASNILDLDLVRSMTVGPDHLKKRSSQFATVARKLSEPRQLLWRFTCW
ncbi:expressed unknown protein [Seminavis robusta]|uniref:Uncharacterized protein n=1 Tax=Seminavis robusta TaxID=568900 RepID=A0A9N8E801_9STRA|nr:expressed unknown protein [Seminavis robusta]|eukprot:Sro720_g192490.1 n/a (117) ;mRNA; r:3931-4281